MSEKFIGTLVDGETYTVGQRKCRNGERRVFSADDAKYLERTAVYATGDGTRTVQRFALEPYEGDKPIGYKFPKYEPDALAFAGIIH